MENNFDAVFFTLSKKPKELTGSTIISDISRPSSVSADGKLSQVMLLLSQPLPPRQSNLQYIILSVFSCNQFS